MGRENEKDLSIDEDDSKALREKDEALGTILINSTHSIDGFSVISTNVFPGISDQFLP